MVKQEEESLSDAPESKTVPEVGDVDELPTFVGSKKDKVWIKTAIDGVKKGFLALSIKIKQHN